MTGMKTVATEKQDVKGALLPKDLGIVKKKVQVDALPPNLSNQITSYVADNYGVLRLVNFLDNLGKLKNDIYYLTRSLQIIDEFSIQGVSITLNSFGSEDDDYCYKEIEAAVIVSFKIKLSNHIPLYRFITKDYDTEIELVENSELYKILGREAENKFMDCLIMYFTTRNYILYNGDLNKLPSFISDKIPNDNILVFKDDNKDESIKRCIYYVVLEFVRDNS